MSRAAFFVGDPRDLDRREWLGCVAHMGGPYSPDIAMLAWCKTEEQYREAVREIAKRTDWVGPPYGWPFPWVNDLFCTEFVYTWMHERAWVTAAWNGFQTFAEWEEARTHDGFALPANIPAPNLVDGTWDQDAARAMVVRIRG